jgi:phosphoglycerate kinase
MAKLSVVDLDLMGQRVFVRVDFNVPLKDGLIVDDTRIRSSLPTIRYCLEHGATVVVASHLGRPKGRPNPEFSLRPVATRLAQLLGRPITFTHDCVGDDVKLSVDNVRASGGVVLLENLRFHPEEEQNDQQFSAALAALADEYVNDAFGAAHRAHASVEGITHHFRKAAAGLLMERELQYLGHVLESPERPFVTILGGAKVSDKIEVIENLLGRAERLLIGGAMAYTFLKSRGVAIGRSLVEDDKLDAARKIEAEAGGRIELPVDHVVTDAVQEGAANEVLDIGDPQIGNRLMGIFEIEAFAAGTNAIARAVASVHGTTIVGGGDSVSAVKQSGVADRITHISTGGGASLEFLAGRTLPGVAALTDK